MTTLAAPTSPPADASACERVRVLVVDDSLIYRKVVRDALATLPNVEVVGSAANGRIAIEKIEQLSPDLITLDFEMPELDGLGVLRWLRQSQRPTKAVMLSALTIEGGEATLQALQEGAFDFVVKPSGDNPQQNQLKLRTALAHRVDAVQSLLARKRPTRSEIRGNAQPAVVRPPVAMSRPQAGLHRIGIVGIGISTGGPDALRVMLPQLPADLPVPVVIVQHMPPVFTRSLADSLNKLCKLRVSEAVDGQLIKAGEIVIAPGGRQMRIHKSVSGHGQVELTDDPPIQSCRPSVDYLFQSLAESFGPQTLSVIMTGMGYDGAEGCRRLHHLGGPVIAQDEASCVVFGMPRKPVEDGTADVVAPLNTIAAEIVRYTGRRARRVKLTDDDIASVCKLVDELTGIQWDASKSYLIESRLPSLLAEHRCTNLADLVSKVRTGVDPRIRNGFIDAITTRETLFFRDESPFEALRHKALPEIIDAKAKTPFAKRLRLWSAACSSGQEPYSLGIVLRELIDDLDDWDVRILATDISQAALAAASKGIYSDFEMSRGMSPHLRDRYFHKVPEGWRICDEIRSLVSFENRNLLKPFTNLSAFDVIFCRNVAIYFDADVKRDLFDRLAGTLTPNGAMFVGSSENLSTFGERWKPLYHCRGIFYQPNRTAAGPVATVQSGPPLYAQGSKTQSPLSASAARPVVTTAKR